jgi:OmcA/MtrC family decaheme c-type cytochrome
MKVGRFFCFALMLGFALGLSAHGQVVPQDGINADIVSVVIPATNRPIVRFRVHSENGKLADSAALDAGSVRFTLAKLKRLPNGETAYENYILSKVTGQDYTLKGERRRPAIAETTQPHHDQGGTLARTGDGVFTYTFKNALPPNYDRSSIHVLGGELALENGKHVANLVYEFVPSGRKIRLQRTVVETAACNSCHDPLKAHNGTRREAGYCVLCHTSQLVDPESGENLDFKVMVHKIHRGRLLPSVKGGKPYFTVAANQQVRDFSTIRYPQAMLADGSYRELRNCLACHANPQQDHWKKFPSSAACTSCHDHVELASGRNHKPGPVVDGSCSGCHQPDGPEFGPSVAGAHTFPGNSTQLAGVVLDILKVEGNKPGENPNVTFSLKNKRGEPLDAAKMDNLRLVVAWPTSDYRVAVEEDARKAEPTGDGIYRYTFRYTIPADAAGSGAMGMQGFKLVDLKKPNGDIIKGQRDVGYNVVKYFPITDQEAVARRQAVKIENCNVCHLALATHGEARRNTEFCVMCHHAAQTDEDKRKKANGPMPTENVHYKRLIHRIHTGRDLGGSWIIYGGTPAKPGPIEFGDIRFPGDRRNCQKCHVPGANEPPLRAGLLPTLLPQADGSTKAVQPITSACLACHTKEAAQVHSETMTSASGQEGCVTCHAVGRTFAVEKVHRR